MGEYTKYKFKWNVCIPFALSLPNPFLALEAEEEEFTIESLRKHGGAAALWPNPLLRPRRLSGA